MQPLIRLARVFWQTGDATLIDGVPNGLAELTVDGSRQAVKIQTGSLAVYAFVMLIGVVRAGRPVPGPVRDERRRVSRSCR